MHTKIDEIRALVSMTSDAVMMCDNAGHVLWCNLSVSKMFGYTAEEMLGGGAGGGGEGEQKKEK